MPHWPIYNMDLSLLSDFAYENIEKKNYTFWFIKFQLRYDQDLKKFIRKECLFKMKLIVIFIIIKKLIFIVTKKN